MRVNRFLWLLIVFAVLFGIYLTVSRSKHLDSLVPLATTPGQEEVSNLAIQGFEGWREFVSPKNDFKVLLPTLPHHATEQLNDGKTKLPKKYDTFVTEKKDGTAFIITRVELPEEIHAAEREQILRDVVNDLLAHNQDNKLKMMQMGAFHDQMSVDFSLQNQEVGVVGKAFLEGRMLYVLTMLSKLDNLNESQFNFFVNSFQLTKP